MKDPKKNLATIIVAKLKGRHEAPAEDSSVDEKQLAAEEILIAVEQHSPEELKTALSKFIMLCMSEHEKAEPESEEY
jgi:hypothetical protein